MWMGLLQDLSDGTERSYEEVGGAGQVETRVNVPLEINVKGSVDTVPQDGHLLRFFWNQLSTGSAAYFTHTLTHSGTTSMPSMTLERADQGGTTTVVKRFTGVKFQKATFSCDEKNFLHIKGDWTAKGVQASGTSPTSITASTALPYIYANGDVSIDGSNILEVYAPEINVNTTLVGQFYQASGGGIMLSELNETERKYDGTFNIGYIDATQYRRFHGNTGSLEVQLAPTEFNFNCQWSKASNDTIRLIGSGCVLKSAQPDSSMVEGTLKQKLAFICKSLTGIVLNAGATGSPL
jgi:hypothetical protein